MQSTKSDKRADASPGTIATKSKGGLTLPAVPVLQGKASNATSLAATQRVNKNEGDLAPFQAKLNPDAESEQSAQAQAKHSPNPVQKKKNKSGHPYAGVSSAGIGQLKLKDSAINTSDAKVAQLAGTKPNQPSMNGRYRIKLSSPREAFTYNNRAALGLDAVLPGHHTVVDKLRNPPGTGKLAAVKIEGNDHWIPLAESIPWPTGDQEVLCIDTVGWEDETAKPVQERDKKCVMDVKIGTYTKSTEQFELEGAGFFKRQFKKIEHNLKDLNRDSRDQGYDIDAGNLRTFLDLAIAPATSSKLQAAMKAVKPKLTDIHRRMRDAPVTFVGSSLFIVYNMTAPEKSDVKLIDPDHPIVIEPPPETEMPPQLIRRAHFAGRWFATWEAYVDKWKSSFGSGMINFMRWFSNLSG